MLEFNRRQLLLGLAGAAVASSWSASGQALSRQIRARSSDGLELVGDVQGPEGAPEIVFVHGLRQSRLSWDRQFADRQLAGFRLVRFDLRGHGDSDKPEDPARYADLDLWADDLAAVLDATAVRRPVLVGWSLGAWVIGGFLRRHPNRPLAALNLVSGVAKFSSDLLTPLAGRYARSTSSDSLTERTAETADFLLACFARRPPEADLLRMMLINGMTPRAVNTGLTRPGAPDLDAVWHGFAGPLLVTHGARDRLVRLAMARHVLQLNSRATLSVYPQSGHSAFYEEPVRFGRELAALRRSVSS